MIPERSRGGALGLVILALILSPGTPLPAQDPSIDEMVRLFNATRAFHQEYIHDTRTREGALFYNGGVEGTFPWERPGGKVDQVRLFADRVVVLIRAVREEGGASPSKKDGLPRFTPPRLYAEGNVRLETAGVVLETDAFFYDAGKRRGLAVGARGQGDLSALTRLGRSLDRRDFRLAESVDLERTIDGDAGPSEPSPGIGEARVLAFRAETLRILDLEHFEGEGLTISLCEYGVPHLGVRSGAARISVADGAAGAAGVPAGEKETRHYLIETEGNRLQVLGATFLPLPPLAWNTEWNANLPLRRVQPGHSSKWGTRLDLDWNVNWALLRTPLARLPAAKLFLEKRSEIGLATDYRSKRGFGYGPQAVYGFDPRRWEPWELDPDSWTYYGEAGYHGIRDKGDDRTSDVEFPDPDRHWTHLIHRQSIPRIGVLDVEVSERSDENFLNEYFERVAKSEKEQESLVYFRRHFRDNIAVTGLYKYRLDDFETAVERLPEGKLFLLEQPVARTGLYSGLVLEGANLRLRPDEALGDPSVRSGRFDALNEWSYPFGFGRLIRFRPFADLRYTAYERGADPAEGSIDREAFGAGITASQEYSRLFRFPRDGRMDRWFGITGLKHVVVPQVTYRNLYSNDVEPAELVAFDEAETVTLDERVELSLRNHLLARGRPVPAARPAGAPPGAGTEARADAGAGEVLTRRSALTPRVREVRSLLDSEVSVDWFTHPGRDNAGKELSFLDLDATFRPHPRLWLHSRTFFDPTERMRFERTDSSVTVVPVLDRLSLTVGERFTRGLSSFSYGLVSFEFSKRYLLDFYYAHDFELGRRSDIEVRLIRIAHEWALELSYEFDAGEGDNHSFSVNVQPVELLGEARRRRERRMASER